MNKEQRKAIRDVVKQVGNIKVIEFVDSLNNKFKLCPHCDEVKSESKFYKRDYHRNKQGKTAYYLSGYCKPCMSIVANKKGAN